MLHHLLSKAKVSILPGKPDFGFMHAALYDAAYAFWLEYWQQTFREVGLAQERIDADDFLRHDIVTTLSVDGRVVGMINCTLLDFDRAPAANHSYVNDYFGPAFVERIREMRLARMATLENIFLDPAWRSSKVGFSLGAVLMAIALRKTREIDCDGVFGAPRKDAPTARICGDLGARTIIEGLEFHGKPTDLMAWARGDLKPHPVPEVNRLAGHLWAARLDATRWPAEPIKFPTVA